MSQNLEEQKKAFFKEMKENGNKLSYDFSKEDHRAVFFAQYGGEGLFQKELPLLYEALKNEAKTINPVKADKFLVGPGDCMEVGNINYDYQDVTSTLVSGKYTEKKLGVDLMGKFLDTNRGTILQSMAIWDEDVANISDIMAVDSKQLRSADELRLQTQAEFFWTEINEENKLCAASQKVCSDVLKITGNNYLVKSVNVIDPMPKDASHLYTELLYDRDPDAGETADYDKFTGVRHEWDKKVYVNIHIPAQVEITLGDNCEFLVEETDIVKGIYLKDFEMKIWSLHNGTVVFNKYDLAKDVVVTYDSNTPNKIKYQFPSNWDHLMELKVVEAKMYADFSCTLPLVCKHGSMEYREGEVTVVISSDLGTTSVDPANKEIKKLHIKFGCLDKECKIQMLDGSERSIEDIRIGDLIRGADEGSLRVDNIYKGMESELVFIETMSGKKIQTTESHPISVVRDGETKVVHAGEVNGADLLKTRDGDEVLKYIYMKPYNDMVYNLELDGGHFFFANGFVVGDFQTQNQCEYEEVNTKTSYPPEIDVEQVQKEMKRLLELYQEYCTY
ncbi:MAG: Hint domain-containing protein [Hespellia sp.]|nr:Hint domain-containing protein [Hespellia sp.]